MAKYLIEETVGTHGYQGLMAKPENRFEVLKPLFESAGCRLEQFYVSGIENKAYLIVESPDLGTVYTLGTTFMAGGAPSAIKCIPLLTWPETIELAEKANSLGYRPPGG